MATKKTKQSNDVVVVGSGTEMVDPAVGRDLMNQLLGQAQAFSAASTLLQTFGVSKLAFVKENKLYKGLAGTHAPNGLELRGTWEEFCGLLGISDEKANQDIENLRAFGEAALEQMSRMGIGYRELRQFRKLPDDQRAALIQIAKGGDKDDVLELAEELLEKARTEHDTLAADKADLTKRNNVLERELEKTSSEYKRYKEKMARQVGKAVFADRTGMVREEALAFQLEGQLAIDSLAKLFDEVLLEPDQTDPERKVRLEFVTIQAKALYTRAALLMESLRQAEAPLDTRIADHFLSAEEAAAWLADAELLTRDHDAKKQLREMAREAEKPKRPGRPKDSLKKAGE